VALSKAS